jgi:hypothetical protein
VLEVRVIDVAVVLFSSVVVVVVVVVNIVTFLLQARKLSKRQC